MNRLKYLSTASLGLGVLISAPVLSGVKTLSSDEMVETYVEDSALILVRPDSEERQEERERVLQTLTISPGEPVLTEAEEEAYREALARLEQEGKLDALQSAEEEFLRRALALSQEELARAQPQREFTPQIPPIIFGQQAEIPDEPFTQNFLNNQLGINYDGENLNFGIGSPPGIDNIQVPRAINEGPISLVPRPGGGFDLSIKVPDQ
ncbi:hypothetical protein [Marinobacter sp. CHS3-4]|uniref:hypothetical protein n=1 Tax=Marinobacter sp. CHS3-4 TaxID=3045174 RepID=UPI0024B5C93B|nr:hypothetical protein [Marinobacter sp. CHS3-4]MDI9245518.1 hypothetical protein [Marinobacter sp. CHS3-4]